MKVKYIVWADAWRPATESENGRQLVYQQKYDQYWVVEYCERTKRVLALHNPSLIESIYFEQPKENQSDEQSTNTTIERSNDN